MTRQTSNAIKYGIAADQPHVITVAKLVNLCPTHTWRDKHSGTIVHCTPMEISISIVTWGSQSRAKSQYVRSEKNAYWGIANYVFEVSEVLECQQKPTGHALKSTYMHAEPIRKKTQNVTPLSMPWTTMQLPENLPGRMLSTRESLQCRP